MIDCDERCPKHPDYKCEGEQWIAPGTHEVYHYHRLPFPFFACWWSKSE
jgi:hypothetical protein